jgi:C1A family cysteine protease
MTFSQENNSSLSQSSSNFQLKSKGLGWIPDVPEQRDYDLTPDKSSIYLNKRLKRNQATESLEKFGAALIDRLQTLFQSQDLQQAMRSLPTELQSLPEDLKVDLFGSISFQDVTIYKSFREGITDSNDIQKVKILLSILGYRGFYKINEENFYDYPSEPQELNKSKIHANWYSSWINSNNFDESTAEIVKAFQKAVNCYITDGLESDEAEKVKLGEDGVVGIRTYTALLLAWYKQEELSSKKLQFQLLPSPVTIPEILFKWLFDSLLQFASQEISKELSRNSRDELFETNKLDAVKLKTITETDKVLFERELGLKQLFKISDIQDQEPDTQDQKPDEILNILKQEFLKLHIACQGESNSRNCNPILKLVQDEFIVLEPILVLLMKVGSPLALLQRTKEKSLVASIVYLLEKRVKPFQVFKNGLKHHPDGTNFMEIYSGDDLEKIQEFTNGCVEKFLQLFDDEGLNSIVEKSRSLKQKTSESMSDQLDRFKPEIFNLERIKQEQEKIKLKQEKISQEQGKFKLTLFLYYLLCKLYKSLNQDEEVLSSTQNIFGKTEVFTVEPETDELGDEKNLSLSRDESDLLSSRIRLTLPMTNHFLQAAKNATRSKKVPYFFLPYAVDLSYWCSPIEDQGSLKSCSAFAGIALLEYFTNRTSGRYTDLSAMFLYKAARNLMQVEGDRGSSLRETMKVMEKFGVPPDRYWPYNSDQVNEEPPQFCYSFAQNYQTLKYFRLDYAGISNEALLFQIKSVLAAGFPCAFGLALHASAGFEENVIKGWIPYPGDNERFVGGHCVVAVGYNDFETVGPKAETNQGALLVRNSWSTDWGRKGYGWLPYSYVLGGLTADWWSLLDANWFEDDLFGLGAIASDLPGNDTGGPSGGGKNPSKP